MSSTDLGFPEFESIHYKVSGCNAQTLNKSMNCINCFTATDNPKFCSRSCAAKYNNQNQPKRKRTKKCKNCASLIVSPLTYCGDCKKIVTTPIKGRLLHLNKTLEEVLIPTGRRASLYRLVRAYATRAITKTGRAKICFHCGYDKHVEVCHIKPIASFALDTPVSVVNDIDNLIYLCPNCHWELDNEVFFL